MLRVNFLLELPRSCWQSVKLRGGNICRKKRKMIIGIHRVGKLMGERQVGKAKERCGAWMGRIDRLCFILPW